MRDYIHVVDLAKGHLAALERLRRPGFEVYNLGTGNGTTVLQLLNTFKDRVKICSERTIFIPLLQRKV